MSHGSASMDAVISSAVLHFARDDAHWLAMVQEMWRVLRPGGVLFVRLATTVGQTALRPLGGGRYVMPDGDTRYLVDHERLIDVTGRLGGSLLDPVRSTVVHELRSMGTWVVRKDGRRCEKPKARALPARRRMRASCAREAAGASTKHLLRPARVPSWRGV